MSGKARLGRLMQRLGLEKPPPPAARDLLPAARRRLEAGRKAWAAGGQEPARALFREAVALDGRVLCADWGVLPHLVATGQGSVRARMQQRLQLWYRAGSELAPPVAALVQKPLMRAWAAEHGFAVPRLLQQADRLADLDWLALPANGLVIKPANGASRRGVVVAIDGFDHMARKPIQPDLRRHVEALWAEAGLSNSAVLVEAAVRDPGAATDPALCIARDFKGFAVAGRVAHVTVMDRNADDGQRGRQSFDRCGAARPSIKQTWRNSPVAPPPPGYAAVIAEMERASTLLPWMLRFDFYLSDEGPLLGEITTYPAAGLDYTPFARRMILQMWEIHPDPFPTASPPVSCS